MKRYFLDGNSDIGEDISENDLSKNSYYDYESDAPDFMMITMPGLIPPLNYPLAYWYTINFYCTAVGSVFEFLFLLAMFWSMLKKNSQLRDYYFVQTSIIILFDMIKILIPADYTFSSSLFFGKELSNALRCVYIIYGFFICIFAPVCQITLTVNRLTAVVIPRRHEKVKFQPSLNLRKLFRYGLDGIQL